MDVPEVLNVHVNKIKKKIYFFQKDFFFKQWKINFWERKGNFFNTFLNFNLFNLIVVIFL